MTEITAARNRVVDKDSDIGEELARRGDEQKGKRASIDAHPVRTIQGDGLQDGVALQRDGELSELPVHQRGNSGHLARKRCRLDYALDGDALRRAEYTAIR